MTCRHWHQKTTAVEPQKTVRKNLSKLGYDVYPNVASVKDGCYQVVTIFHVLEHFTNPLEELRLISRKMVGQGKIIIEVPHANDFLISFLKHESFKKFTFLE